MDTNYLVRRQGVQPAAVDPSLDEGQSPAKVDKARLLIVDDIREALDGGRINHASELFMALRHFLETHPEGRAGLLER